jgi:hypothetical protein
MLLEFRTCVEQEVGSHQRQVYDRYMAILFRVRVILVSHTVERDVYVQQGLQHFRRHGLTGSLGNFEQL